MDIAKTTIYPGVCDTAVASDSCTGRTFAGMWLDRIRH